MSELKRRLAKLEESVKPAGCQCKGPVIYDDEEPGCCPVHGYLRGYIVVPRVLPLEEWLRRCRSSRYPPDPAAIAMRL